ncbi:MAG: PAS domain-containing protein, partial [Paracoccus sp. (in: a-proteobacteria)]|nr:PAS domain-containing protein [Paracoccus sp. (in: a-proteobacteria)]
MLNDDGVTIVAVAILSGTVSVLLAVSLIRLWDRRPRRFSRSPVRDRLETSLQPMVFLFKGTQLIDATPPAHGLLDRIAGPGDDWGRLQQWLGPRFPDAPERLARMDRLGRVEMTGAHGRGSAALRLTAEDLGDRVWRLTLSDPTADNAGIIVDSMSLQAMEEELELLQRALDQTPMLVWRQDAEDRIIWANAAYLRRAEARSDDRLGWPLPRLFDTPRPVPGAGTATRRAALEDNG